MSRRRVIHETYAQDVAIPTTAPNEQANAVSGEIRIYYPNTASTDEIHAAIDSLYREAHASLSRLDAEKNS